LNTRS